MIIKKCLFLTKSQAFDKLRSLIFRLNSYYDSRYRVSLDSSMGVGFARTYDFDENGCKSLIGIKGLSDIKIGLSRYVSDLNFTRAIVALFHEDRHACNVLRGYAGVTGNKGDDILLSLSYLAKQGNEGYYLDGYSKCLYEIDAEHSGVDDAYDYLKSMFPEKADKMICEYVNWRVDNSTYFISPAQRGNRKFRSIEEIDASFEKAFDEAKVSKKYYRDVCKKSDEVMKLLVRPEWKSFHDKLASDFETVADKDRGVSSVVCYLHKDYKARFPTLTNVDLSGKAVFGMSFPSGEKPVRKQVAPQRRMPKEIDCDDENQSLIEYE